MKVKVLVVQGKPKGKCLSFPIGEFVFGRGEECHIRPNSPWVSRQHCLLKITEQGVIMRDLGSRNGTLLNGKRVLGECQLQLFDKLQIGPLVLEIVEVAPPTTPMELVSARIPEGDPDL